MESDLSSPKLSSPLSSPPSSSPLSLLSNSPSLPSSPTRFDASKRYPSPSSSTVQSGSASPVKSLEDFLPVEICVRTDGPPPAKRRRVAGPKQPRVRTTEYLDLENTTDDGEQDQLCTRLLTVLRKKKRIVVIAGAGISVSAGIPDFRSSTGLFTTLRGQHKLKASGKHLFDASVYKDDASTASFHTMLRELVDMTEKAKPTPFHHMLASLAHEGRLMRLYTQNVDGLDTGMPPLATNVPLNNKGPWPTTIQVHGGLAHMVCSKCVGVQAFDSSRFVGSEPPLCQACEVSDQVRTVWGKKRSHGIGRLRPRIVLYNEHNPDDEAIGMVSRADLRRVPDAVIVVGTSLKIPGVRRIVKEMCQVTRSRRDGFTAWINIDPEPQGEFRDCWDVVVRGKCDDVAELVNLPRWDQQVDEEKEEANGGKRSWEVTPDAEEIKEKRHQKNPVVNITPVAEAKSRLIVNLTEQTTPGGIPTPTASPKLRSVLPVAAKGTAKSKQSRLLFPASKTTTAGNEEQKSAKRKKKEEPATASKASKVAKPRKIKQTQTPSTPTPAKKGGTKATKATKGKKVAGPAKQGITTAFKTTKLATVEATDSEKPPKVESPSLPPMLPSSPFFEKGFPWNSSEELGPLDRLDQSDQQLPALRPSSQSSFSRKRALSGSNNENARPTSSRLSSFPLRLQTPPPHSRGHERRVSADTISPISKPRSLSHLID